MTQELYIEYLTKIYLKSDGNNLSSSSVQKYGMESIRMINKILSRTEGEDFSIFNIDDIDNLRLLGKKLFLNPDFIKVDFDGHNMYSAGFNRYLEYAEGYMFKGKSDVLEQIDKPELLVDLPEEKRDKKTVIKYIPDRNRIKIIQSEQAYNYICQIDSSHNTFTVQNTNHQYMEGHHIIPLSRQDDFEYNLDCYANILVVCPTCHRFFHYAEKKERDKKLNLIYDYRGERLAKSGFNLSRREFLDAVDIFPSGKVYSYS